MVKLSKNARNCEIFVIMLAFLAVSLLNDYIIQKNKRRIAVLISFSCANILSFKNEKTLSMLAAIPVKEFQDDNSFEIDRYVLLKSAVIYGANAGGKSNFLQAMNRMKWLVINSSKNMQKGEPLYINNFKLNINTINEPSKFEITLLIDGIKYRYGFKANNSEIQSEWLFFSKKIKEYSLFLREGNGIEVFDKFKEGKELEERTRENALFLSVCAQFNGDISEKILSWFNNFNIISGLEDRLYQNFSENMFLSNLQDKSIILDFINKADLGIQDINIKRQKLTEDNLPPEIPKNIAKSLLNKEGSFISTTHNVYDEKKNVVNQTIFDFETQESEGSKKYFRLSGPIIDTLRTGKILVIDELDARLHPILTLEIVKLFNSKITNPYNAQLIFATHDTNLLSAKIFRRDQIWFTEKDNEEATDFYSLIEYKLSSGKIRNDASFEKDYIQGRYGAIPFPGDFKSIWNK